METDRVEATQIEASLAVTSRRRKASPRVQSASWGAGGCRLARRQAAQ